jgi:hypothetical protein
MAHLPGVDRQEGVCLEALPRLGQAIRQDVPLRAEFVLPEIDFGSGQ